MLQHDPRLGNVRSPQDIPPVGGPEFEGRSEHIPIRDVLRFAELRGGKNPIRRISSNPSNPKLCLKPNP